MSKKLLSYPNKTFSRAQLMDEFWGIDSETSYTLPDCGTNFLSAVVSPLRPCGGSAIRRCCHEGKKRAAETVRFAGPDFRYLCLGPSGAPCF